MSTGTDPIILTDEQRKHLTRILAAEEPVEITPDEDSLWIKSKGTYDSLLVRFPTEESG